MSKVALVVGGSGGIGEAIVKALIKDGLTVCATYHEDKKASDRITGDVKSERLSFHKTDAASEDSVRSTLDQIISSHKTIDIVVFSATPPITPGQFFNTKWDDFERHIDLHVKGFFNIAKCLSSQIKAGNRIKFIVILTELCAGKPSSGMSDYITAKYALMGLSKTLAVELARYGCTVNMVSPGMTDTALVSGFPAKLAEMTAEQNPLRRIGRPEDVAGVVSFLASEGADYINGANILVNGGSIME